MCIRGDRPCCCLSWSIRADLRGVPCSAKGGYTVPLLKAAVRRCDRPVADVGRRRDDHSQRLAYAAARGISPTRPILSAVQCWRTRGTASFSPGTPSTSCHQGLSCIVSEWPEPSATFQFLTGRPRTATARSNTDADESSVSSSQLRRSEKPFLPGTSCAFPSHPRQEDASEMADPEGDEVGSDTDVLSRMIGKTQQGLRSIQVGMASCSSLSALRSTLSRAIYVSGGVRDSRRRCCIRPSRGATRIVRAVRNIGAEPRAIVLEAHIEREREISPCESRPAERKPAYSTTSPPSMPHARRDDTE